MVDIVRIKRSHDSGDVPATVLDGQLVVNTADKKLWVGDALNQRVELAGLQGVNGLAPYISDGLDGFVAGNWVADENGDGNFTDTGIKAQGVDGDQGPQGTQGLQGIQGPTGLTGNTGDQGVPGNDGNDGLNGATGAAGLAPYIDGATGNWFADDLNDGDYDDTGVKAQGSTGDTGPTGPAGPTAVHGGADAATNLAIVHAEDAKIYVPSTHTHTLGSDPVTLQGFGELASENDANNDGKTYGRKNLAWEETANIIHTHTLTDIIDSKAMAAVDDANSDDIGYVRKNGGWAPELGSSILTGLKNVLLNPLELIDTYGFGGDWVEQPVGTFGLDRWKASLDGFKYQAIPALAIFGGEEYTLSWNSGGVGQIRNGNDDILVSGESPLTAVMTKFGSMGAYCYLPYEATVPQMELGLVGTNFEARDQSIEAAMCAYYHWKQGATVYAFGRNAGYVRRDCTIPLGAQMRAGGVVINGTVTDGSQNSAAYSGSILAVDITADSNSVWCAVSDFEINAEIF